MGGGVNRGQRRGGEGRGGEGVGDLRGLGLWLVVGMVALMECLSVRRKLSISIFNTMFVYCMLLLGFPLQRFYAFS